MTNTTDLEDFKINVKFKLSALWISLMFCYLYGDFFTLFVPSRIENLMNGNSGAGATTPLKLLLFALLMAIPSLMVFLSLVLRPNVSRVINLSMGMGYTAIMVLVVFTSLGSWMMFYTFLGAIEIVITSLIIFYAWKWPKNNRILNNNL